VYGDRHSKKLKAFGLSSHKQVTQLGIIGESGDGGSYGPFQVMAGRIGGRQAVISAAGYDGVHVIDLHTGELISPPFDAANANDDAIYSEVHSVALGELDGRSVVISGWADGTIRVFDPITGRRIGKSITKHVHEDDPSHNPDVDSIFTVKTGGRWAVVSRDAEGGVHVWDLATRKDIKSN
jgi:WD40 repeat protein